MKYLFCGLVVALCVAGNQKIATADLSLTFDQPSYSISAAGQSTVVSVFLVQSPGGTQIGAGNALLSAAIDFTFNSPSGIAAVNSLADINGDPLFDSISKNLQPAGTPTTATLGELSVAGLTDLSVPLLLGTFQLTGLANGTTTIQVASKTPGSSFVTTLGNMVNPVNVPSATVFVGVPEPSAWTLAACGLAILALLYWKPIWTRRSGDHDCLTDKRVTVLK
jgi:hypothetical protein